MVTRERLEEYYWHWHYLLWERHGAKWCHALTRGWHRQMQRRWEVWQRRRETQHETRRMRMEAVNDALIEKALARSILDKSSQELRASLLAEVWEQYREELLQRAVEQVRQEQQEAEASRRETWRIEKAVERRAMEREAQQTAEAEVARERVVERQDFEARMDRLIRQRNEWKARATDAEAWIVDHITGLLPEGSRVLLKHAEITRVRLHTLNTILRRVGLEVQSKLTDIAPIATEVGPQHWEQRSRFWCRRVASGVVDEDNDEDAGALMEASEDATGN